MAFTTSGSSAEGGTVTVGTGLPSVPSCGTSVTVTFESAATRSRVLRTSSGSSPGKILQFTLARAVWGKALGACPPESMVGTPGVGGGAQIRGGITGRNFGRACEIVLGDFVDLHREIIVSQAS